jgi:hypothetical protein
MEPVEASGIRDKAGTFRLEHLPDCLVAQFGVTVRLGICNTLVQQPGIQFVVILDPQPRGEEAFPYQTNLVLDLTLLPT